MRSQKVNDKTRLMDGGENHYPPFTNRQILAEEKTRINEWNKDPETLDKY